MEEGYICVHISWQESWINYIIFGDCLDCERDLGGVMGG
jgi:hypothetical protein